MTEPAAPVKPLPADMAATITWAVDQRERMRAIAREAISGGLRNVWFVACGGSLYASSPAGYLLSRRARSFTAFRMNASEFNHLRPAAVGPDSLVVVGSHSGKTPETLAAIETARSLGVRTIMGIGREVGSPLGQGVDEMFGYNSLHTVWEPKQVLLAYLAHGLLTASGDQDTAVEEVAARSYAALPGILPAALTGQDEALAQIAAKLAGEPVIQVLGSGPNEDVARCLAMCYLQEMQWMHAAAFNAGDFFHGAFEVVTESMPVILFLGRDATRPVAERAARFLDKYTKLAYYIDAADLEMPGVAAESYPEIDPIVLGSTAVRLAQHFEAVTGHSLDIRRYMFKVEY
ncbi:MAG: SIS domain-containing protein [Streptosporangiaceae bacterium]